VIAWRLATTRRRAAAFAGEGARRYGGRWNPVGVPIVYAATTLSLAALEVLGHVEPEEARRYWCYRIDVPDAEVERVEIARLPRGWNAARPRAAAARLGGLWATSLRTVALLVPSVHVPTGEELNVLLNPRHPGFASLAIGEPRPYSFDPRLLPR
jgi:RES domain-containing protein